MEKKYISAQEVAEIMECSERHGYKVIQELNAELKGKGYLVRAGRVPRRYFLERTGLQEEVAQ